jgi:hypothetical protein
MTDGCADGDGDASSCCPVCLGQGLPMVRTRCAHLFCRACIERVLSSSVTRHGSSSDGDPTRAPCPLCREEMVTFELEHADTGQPLHPRNEDLSALSGCTFVQHGPPELAEEFASYHFPPDGAAPCAITRPAAAGPAPGTQGWGEGGDGVCGGDLGLPRSHT